jgi:hypothetical protein
MKKKSTKKGAVKVNSEVAFLKFLKDNKDLSRTKAYNNFRSTGGKIRKQRALEISRSFVSANKGEFLRRSISSIGEVTSKEIKEGKRTKRKPLIHKDLKPKKGYSNILNSKGEFISKKEATELRRVQRRLREEEGAKITIKQLALSKGAYFFEGDSEMIYAYTLRAYMMTSDLGGERSITLIDRNGTKHAFFGTYDDLFNNNDKFIMVIDGEQQRLFSGAEKSLNERGLERDKAKDSAAYKVFQMSVQVTNFRDDKNKNEILAQVIDYREIETIDGSPIDGDEIMEGRKKVRK